MYYVDGVYYETLLHVNEDFVQIEVFLDFQAPSYEINVFNPNATNTSLNVESLLKSRCSTP